MASELPLNRLARLPLIIRRALARHDLTGDELPTKYMHPTNPYYISFICGKVNKRTRLADDTASLKNPDCGKSQSI